MDHKVNDAILDANERLRAENKALQSNLKKLNSDLEYWKKKRFCLHEDCSGDRYYGFIRHVDPCRYAAGLLNDETPCLLLQHVQPRAC